MSDGQEKPDGTEKEKECEKMKMWEKILEYYKIAIDGRKTLLENYNHWMNMYAIINGALFVGFYSIAEKSSDAVPFIIKFAILVLGCVAGWLWHFSTKGYYDWMLSWLNVISFYENKLRECTESDSVYIYRAFIISKGNKMLNEKTIQPFSTQKLTQKFTLVVAIVWSLITGCIIYNKLCEVDIEIIRNNICFIVCPIVIAIVICFIVKYICKKWCMKSDLRKTHKIRIKNGIDKFDDAIETNQMTQP